jgi:hypothetical protein
MLRRMANQQAMPRLRKFCTRSHLNILFFASSHVIYRAAASGAFIDHIVETKGVRLWICNNVTLCCWPPSSWTSSISRRPSTMVGRIPFFAKHRYWFSNSQPAARRSLSCSVLISCRTEIFNMYENVVVSMSQCCLTERDEEHGLLNDKDKQLLQNMRP